VDRSTIDSLEKYDAYKADFTQLYRVYRSLYTWMESNKKEFEEYARLRENLRQMLEPPPQAQI